MWSSPARLRVDWHACRGCRNLHLAGIIAMASAIVSVLIVALLVGVIALLKWRLTLAGSRRRDFVQAGTPQGRMNLAFYGLRAVSPQELSLFGGNSLGGGPVSPRVTKEQRAEAFFLNNMATTGATKED